MKLMRLTALFLLTAGTAHAEVTANIGFASDYYYRGILQAPNSASGGIDYEKGGFYAGAWTADVKDGLEIDGYFGYGGSVGDFGYSVGYTGYFYTGDFDDTYQEINLGTSYGIASFELAVGEYDNFDGPQQDYSYYALTLEKAGFYGKYAGFARDFTGEYVELGYSATIGDGLFDLGIAAIFANADLVGESDESLVLSVGKTFDIR